MATFWQHFLENDVIFVISINIGNSRKPLEIKEKAAISGGFQSVEMRGIEPRNIKPESLTPA